MSRRFGRNQKRRARQEVAEAQERARVAQACARTLGRSLAEKDAKIRGLMEVVEGVRDALGRQSFLLQPTLARIAQQALCDVQIAEDVAGFQVEDCSKPISAELQSFRLQTAAVLDASIGADHWSRQVHFNLRVSEGRAHLRYALDERLLHEPGARKRVATMVARYMAEAFEAELASMGART